MILSKLSYPRLLEVLIMIKALPPLLVALLAFLNVGFAQEISKTYHCAILPPPYPVEVSQPSGESLTIQILGDRFLYRIETADGYTVLKDSTDGFYKYAKKAKYGALVPSEFKAFNVEERSAIELGHLDTTALNLNYSGGTLLGKMTARANFLSANTVPAKSATSSTVSGGNTPTVGSITTIMLLIDYPDQPFEFTQGEFDDLMNLAGYSVNGQTGSFRDFYLDNSYNLLDVNTDVLGWYTAANNRAFYASDAASLVREAIDAAEAAGTDFATYDNDGDGTCDVINVIHSGRGQEETGDTDDIWSHRSGLGSKAVTYDGTDMNSYIVNPEKYSGAEIITNIGVICHEFGHSLGLPDLYDANGATDGESSGCGNWCTMAGGSWNNSGKTPPHFNPWAKQYLNWIQPNILTGNGTESGMDNTSNGANYHRINTLDTEEYFLLANNQENKWNAHLATTGLVIWHIDEGKTSLWPSSNTVNGDASLLGVVPDQADGNNDLENYNGTDDGDPYPGSSGNDTFDDSSTPNSNTNDGSLTGITIRSIAESSGLISFDYQTIPSCGIDPVNLDAFNITSSGARTCWETGDGVDYDLEYGPTGFGLGAGVPIAGPITSQSMTYDIAGLVESTTYDVYVRDNCSSTGGGNSNWVGPFTFTTLCATTFTVPFNEDFENAGSIPTCWNQSTEDNEDWLFHTGPTTTSTTGPDAAHSGSYYAYLESSDSQGAFAGEYGILLSPQIDLSGTSQPRAAFFYHMYGNETGRLKFEIESPAESGNWTTLWEEIGEQHASGSTPFAKATVDLTSYIGLTIRTRFYATVVGNVYGDIAIDYVSFEETPVCLEPEVLSATAILTSSADLNWTSGGSSTWDIEWGAAGFTPGTGTTITGVTGIPYPLSGLSAGTAYEFYVRDNCTGTGDGTSDWVGPASFTTLCSIESIPYTEDFENAGALPSCWTQATNDNQDWTLTNAATPSSNTGPDAAHSGSYYVFLEADDAANFDKAYLVSSGIDLSGATNPRALINYHMYGGTMGTARMDIESPAGSDNWISAWTLGGETQTASTDAFVEVNVDLSAFIGQIVAARFVAIDGNGSEGDIAIDLVTFEDNPCPDLSALEVVLSGATSVTLTWLPGGSESSWEIEYGDVGFIQGSGTTVPASIFPHEITGLLPTVEYDFYVRGDCGSGNYSNWIGPTTGTTAPPESVGAGNRLYFDGSAQYVSSGAISNLSDVSTKTIEMWIRLDNNTNDGSWGRRMFNLGGQSYLLNVFNDNIYWWSVADGWQQITSSFPDQKWGHIAVTYDGTEIKGYINGSLAWTFVGSFDVGSAILNLGEGVKTHLDEVRVWSVELSASEIRDWMCEKVTNSHPQYASMELYYRLDEGAGYSVTGDYVNSNTGTLTGMDSSTDWEASTAPIGDDSEHDYAGSSSVALINHLDGDMLTAIIATGTPDGIHVYRNDAEPDDKAGLDESPVSDRYYGVFVANGNGSTFDLNYMYAGNSFVSPGNEADVRLVDRKDSGSSTWTSTSASQDQAFDLFELTGQIDTVTEYTLDVPACPGPTDLNVSNLLDVSADIGWTSSGTTWDLEFGTAGFTLGSGTQFAGISSNPYSLTGITASTSYDVYVRRDCNGTGDGYSDWIGPLNFTTAPVEAVGQGNMLYTDGTDQYLLTPDLGIGDFDQKTIEMWVKLDNNPDAFGNGPKLFSWQGGTWMLTLPFTTDLRWWSIADSWNSITGSMTDQEWVHVAVTFDGAEIKVYLDGVLAHSSVNQMAVGDGYLYFGQNLESWMDEIRVWSTALTESEIRDWMCQKVTNFHPQYSSLEAYYRLDESSGSSIAPDYSPNGNDATLTNMDAAADWEHSNAPVGDESAHDYNGSSSTITLSHPDGDSFNSSIQTGAPDGLHVYRIDNTPDSTAGLDGGTYDDRYWGTFITNGSGATCRGVLDYTGNAFAAGQTESDLRISKRVNNSTNTEEWVQQTELPNETLNILTLTFLSDSVTEFILDYLACPAPSGLGVSDVTSVAADISWTSNGDTWDIEYGINGYTQGTGTTIPGVIDNPFLLIGLTPGTWYDVYVRRDCNGTGGGYSSWIGPVDFTTTAPEIVGSGNSLEFDGVDDHVTFGDASKLTFTEATSFSVGAWVKWTGTGNGSIFSKMDAALPFTGYDITLISGGDVQFQLVSDLGISDYLEVVTSSGKFADAGWHQVTVTYDGSGIAAGVNIFVDGYKESLTTNVDALTGIVSTAADANIGMRNGSLNPFTGVIDELVVWNGEMVENDIQQYLCQKVGSSHPEYGSLAAYYRFDGSANSAFLADDLGETTGTLVMDPPTDWITSGAPIGDESAYDYSIGSKSAMIQHADGDSFFADEPAGDAIGIHVYRIDTVPIDLSGVDGLQDNDRYYGLFIAGSGDVDITYVYKDNPKVNDDNESLMDFYRRDGNDGSWTDQLIAPDTPNDLFLQSGQTPTIFEYTIDEMASIWTGSFSDEWSDGQNWESGDAPTAFQAVNIPNDCVTYPKLDIDVQVSTLAVQDEAFINIADHVLELTGNLTLFGFNLFEVGGTFKFSGSNRQYMMSGKMDTDTIDVKKTGGVLTFTADTDTIDVKSKVKVEGDVMLDAGAILKFGCGGSIGSLLLGSLSGDVLDCFTLTADENFRLISTPIQSETVAEWDDDLITTGFTGSDYPSFGFVNIYTYDESQLGGKDDNGWVPASNTTDNISNYGGYYVYSGGATYYVDNLGPINKGPIVMPVTHNASGPADDEEDGWNLLGNPLPSNIDFTGISYTDIQDMYWILDPASGNTAVWDEGAGSGTIGANGILRKNQGFWVHAYDATPPIVPSMTIPEAAKTSSGATTYMKAGTLPILRMKLSSGMNTFYDEAFIKLQAGATKDYEQLDAVKFYSDEPTVPGIAMLTDDGVEVTINGMSDFLDPISIPVKIKAGLPGTYDLKFTDEGLLSPEFCVVIEDMVSGTITDLNSQDSLSFFTSGTNAIRFYIHISKRQIPEVTDISCAGLSDGTALMDNLSSWNYVWTNSLGDTIQETSGVLNDQIVGLAVGTYFLTTSGLNCPSSASQFTVTEPAPIVVSEDINDELIGADGSIELLINGGTPTYLFDWDSDGVGDFDDLQDQFGLTNGTYNVVVQDANGCEISASYILQSTGINDLENVGFTVYPSLMEDHFRLSFDSVVTKMKLQLMNSSGKLILSKELNGSSFEIDVADLATGTYVLVLSTKSEVVTKKLMKI